MAEPNLYKPDDNVRTHVKGEDIEVTVRTVWKDELQVRLPGGALVWRTVRTVRAINNSESTAGGETEEVAPEQVIVGSEPTAELAPVAETTGDQVSPEHEAGEPTAVEGNSTPSEVEQPLAPSPVLLDPAAEFTSCGAPEDMADRKRGRRKGGRRK